MDFDEMLSGCTDVWSVDMDELINFWARFRL